MEQRISTNWEAYIHFLDNTYIRHRKRKSDTIKRERGLVTSVQYKNNLGVVLNDIGKTEDEIFNATLDELKEWHTHFLKMSPTGKKELKYFRSKISYLNAFICHALNLMEIDYTETEYAWKNTRLPFTDEDRLQWKNKRKPLTDEDRLKRYPEVVTSFLEGMSISEVSKKNKISGSLALTIRKSLVKTSDYTWKYEKQSMSSQNRIDKYPDLAKNLMEGMTIIEVCAKYKLSRSLVQRVRTALVNSNLVEKKHNQFNSDKERIDFYPEVTNSLINGMTVIEAAKHNKVSCTLTQAIRMSLVKTGLLQGRKQKNI